VNISEHLERFCCWWGPACHGKSCSRTLVLLVMWFIH